MGKVTFNAAQVPANPTYNWSPIDQTMGLLDIGVVTTDAPGNSPLPSAVFSPQLGQIIRGWDPTLGFGEFIYLAIPKSTAIPLGTLVSWDFSATAPTQYSAIAVPAKATSQKTGAPVAVCISSTIYNSGSGITSNANSVQYAWFQLGGATQLLKTAVQVAPVATEQSAGVYVSTTAGRIYVTASAGGQILGARLANTATVTSTASCVLVYLNGRPAIEGA